MTIPLNSALIGQTKFAIEGSDLHTTKFEKDFIPLSIDELILQCQQTMEKLDGQIRGKMSDQKERNDSLAALGKLSDLVSTCPTVPAGAGPDAAKVSNDLLAMKDANGASIDSKLDELARNHPELKDTIDAVRANVKDGLTAEEAKACGRAIDNASDSLRNDNETSMISLQSLVSKRSQALQMTSNLVNSMNESAKSVVQNIR